MPPDLREQVFKAGFTTRAAGSNWPEIPASWSRFHQIVRSLIEAAGGTAQACSSPGGGARFELGCPLLPACTKSSTAADW